jgi:phosphoglycerol transferase MdoB-like AlkP superfamily enzyme
MGQSFYMASSEIGGGTCNVEFEALTGLTNAFLPAGSMAYGEYISKKIPALPWYFKKFGYTATAIHPYLKSFWNRDKVYPYLGFDKFYSMEDMPNAQRKGSFISDKALSEKIIEQYEAGGEQQFIFAVSMQNHFPYYQNYYKKYSLELDGDLLTADLKGILHCYSQGIHDADSGLNDLIEFFSKVDYPVNIIFYGDHYPSLTGFTTDRLNDSGIPSFISRDNAMIGSIKNKFTPVAFWSNYGAKIPDCSGKEYSALSYSVLEYAGLPLNSYYSVLKDGFNSMPVLQKNLVIDGKGQITDSVPESLSPIYNTLDILNYDALFGNQYLFNYLWDN